MTSTTCVMGGSDTYTVSFTPARGGATAVGTTGYEGVGLAYMGYNGVWWEVDQDFSATRPASATSWAPAHAYTKPPTTVKRSWVALVATAAYA